MTIENIFKAPSDAIPKPNTQAYELLMMLAEKDVVPELDLMLKFNGNQRSPLQALGKDGYRFWLVHPVEENNVIIGRQLDWRHKSGDWELDQQAREERMKKFKRDSYLQAVSETKRLPKARKDYEATKEKGSEH